MSITEGSSKALRAYLPHSVTATALVLLLPLSVLWLCTSVIVFSIPGPAILLMSLALGLVAAGVASEVWARRPEAADISFGELMIWSWYRLQKADTKLAASKQLVNEVAATPEQQLAVLQELSDALESKDPYTRGHSSRVERHAFNIAIAMGLQLKDIEALRKAASLHDVGKMRIPNRVLHKPGRLDDDERLMIEEHPVVGAWMVSGVGDSAIVETVRHHHERWDGLGYPDKISGVDIPLFARIIAVADTYDAITSTRSYRAGASRKKALDIIRAESGKQFDPDVVEAFLTTLPARGPVVAGLLLLGGPSMLWRRSLQWLKRFGSGSLAPGLGAVGAAVVLGASTFVAPPASAPATREGTVSPSSSRAAEAASAEPVRPLRPPDASADQVLGKRLHRKRAESRKEARSHNAATKTARNDRRSSTKERRAIAAPAPSQPSTGAPVNNDRDAAPRDAEVRTTAPEPDPAPVNDALEEIVDPQDDKGKDCEPGLGTRSKGSRLHCD